MKKLMILIVCILSLTGIRCSQGQQTLPEKLNKPNFKMSVHDGSRTLQHRYKKGWFWKNFWRNKPEIPDDVRSINVVVKKIFLVKEDDSVLELYDGSAVFDLLNLTPENPYILPNGMVPAGRYKQVQFKLDDKGTIKIKDSDYYIQVTRRIVKVPVFFEVTENDFFSLAVDFNLERSLDFNYAFYWLYCNFPFGHGKGIFDKRWAVIAKLNPTVSIESTSLLPLGPFVASGLIAGQNTVVNLNPTGTIHFLSSFDPRFEIRGHYFYEPFSKTLHVEPDTIACTACGGASALPASAMSEISPFDMKIATWNENTISGSVKKMNTSVSVPVSFQRTENFAVSSQPSTSTNVIVNFPNNSYNGKIAVLVLTPAQGNRFFSICNISDRSASFAFKIPNSELGTNIGDMRSYGSSIFVVNDLASLKISALDGMVQSATVGLSTTTYNINIRLSNKVLSTSIPFTENFQ